MGCGMQQVHVQCTVVLACDPDLLENLGAKIYLSAIIFSKIVGEKI